MVRESLLQTVTGQSPMLTRWIWERIVEYLNADLQADQQALHRSVQLMFAFGGVPERQGVPDLGQTGQQSIADSAVRFQPDVRQLFHWVCEPDKHPDGKAAAVALLNEHTSHITPEFGEGLNVADFESIGGLRESGRVRTLADVHRFRGVMKELAKAQRKAKVRGNLAPRQVDAPLALNRALRFEDFLDPICAVVLDHAQLVGRTVIDLQGRIPIRICKHDGCERFFVRRTKALFCSTRCSRLHSKRPREENALYQYEYLARKLRVPGLRVKVRELKARRMEPSKKKQRMGILLRLLGDRER